jgi:hypothetical protein
MTWVPERWHFVIADAIKQWLAFEVTPYEGFVRFSIDSKWVFVATPAQLHSMDRRLGHAVGRVFVGKIELVFANPLPQPQDKDRRVGL